MKLSEISLREIANQIRREEEYLDDDEKAFIEILRVAAVGYIKSYTKLSETELDNHDDITVAALVLISDMYDNRQMTVTRGNVNKVVDTILGMYCTNLL